MSSHHKKKTINLHHRQEDNARAKRRGLGSQRQNNFEARRQQTKETINNWYLAQWGIIYAYLLGIFSWVTTILRLVFR